MSISHGFHFKPTRNTTKIFISATFLNFLSVSNHSSTPRPRLAPENSSPSGSWLARCSSAAARGSSLRCAARDVPTSAGIDPRAARRVSVWGGGSQRHWLEAEYCSAWMWLGISVFVVTSQIGECVSLVCVRAGEVPCSL